MPQDAQALVDRNRRPIVRSATVEPRFPFPVPNDWFIVAGSRDLMLGQVKTFKVFDTDVVLFRGGDGASYMLEAYCAHPACISAPATGSRKDAFGVRFTDGDMTVTRVAATRSRTAT